MEHSTNNARRMRRAQPNAPPVQLHTGKRAQSPTPAHSRPRVRVQPSHCHTAQLLSHSPADVTPTVTPTATQPSHSHTAHPLPHPLPHSPATATQLWEPFLSHSWPIWQQGGPGARARLFTRLQLVLRLPGGWGPIMGAGWPSEQSYS